MKIKTIPITFKVSYMQGDTTEYMQRSVELEPKDLYVQIELPTKKKYFAKEFHSYWEEVKVAEVTGGTSPETPSPIILTPAGIAKARELVNEAFKPLHTYAENHEDEEEVEPKDW